MAIRASILGASGYSGGELVRLLARHPHVQLDALFANQAAGSLVSDMYPWYHGSGEARFEQFSTQRVAKCDVVFLGLPSGEAMKIVPELTASGKRVVDLGGDFRLQDVGLYEKYYKQKHVASNLLPKAVYGLPEWNASEISHAKIVANPGCYPTSIILPLAPLLKDGLIAIDHIVINSLSGVSGAGKKATLELSFNEVNESVRAYKVGAHQHIPEIGRQLATIVGKDVSFSFVPHLISITRGIYTTISCELNPSVSEDDILNSYMAQYADAPFVRVKKHHVPEIKHVLHTNFINIGFSVYPNTGQLIIHSVIDNLVKGAAGQAVQNMNLMYGLSECEALL